MEYRYTTSQLAHSGPDPFSMTQILAPSQRLTPAPCSAHTCCTPGGTPPCRTPRGASSLLHSPSHRSSRSTAPALPLVRLVCTNRLYAGSVQSLQTPNNVTPKRCTVFVSHWAKAIPVLAQHQPYPGSLPP